MISFEDHYGHWALVILMVILASWIFYRYAAPKSWREWRGAGLVQAFIIALGVDLPLVSGSRELASLGGYAAWQAGGNPTERGDPEPRRLL